MDNGEEQTGDHEYGLVMPFVACKSQGGPYDDAGFVAGFACANVASQLESAGGATLSVQVRSDLLAQLDLIAMREGYRLVADSSDDSSSEWTLAIFQKSA